MVKKTDKVSISLKKEDERPLLKARAYYEAKYGRPFSLADVVRAMSQEVAARHAA